MKKSIQNSTNSIVLEKTSIILMAQYTKEALINERCRVLEQIYQARKRDDVIALESFKSEDKRLKEKIEETRELIHELLGFTYNQRIVYEKDVAPWEE